MSDLDPIWASGPGPSPRESRGCAAPPRRGSDHFFVPLLYPHRQPKREEPEAPARLVSKLPLGARVRVSPPPVATPAMSGREVREYTNLSDPKGVRLLSLPPIHRVTPTPTFFSLRIFASNS